MNIVNNPAINLNTQQPAARVAPQNPQAQNVTPIATVALAQAQPDLKKSNSAKLSHNIRIYLDGNTIGFDSEQNNAFDKIKFALNFTHQGLTLEKALESGDAMQRLMSALKFSQALKAGYVTNTHTYAALSNASLFLKPYHKLFIEHLHTLIKLSKDIGNEELNMQRGFQFLILTQEIRTDIEESAERCGLKMEVNELTDLSTITYFYHFTHEGVALQDAIWSGDNAEVFKAETSFWKAWSYMIHKNFLPKVLVIPPPSTEPETPSKMHGIALETLLQAQVDDIQQEIIDEPAGVQAAMAPPTAVVESTTDL